MAKKNIKYEFVGKGALIQFIGLICLPFFPLGTIAGIILFFVGSAASKVYRCSDCGTKLADGQVKVCPACRAALA